jgi:hypothetical protein
MPDQHGFGDNGTESTRPRQSGQGDDQMNEYHSEVAHSGNGINSKNTALRPIWQFAIDRFRTYRTLELALYHSLAKLPEPESTHEFSDEPHLYLH